MSDEPKSQELTAVFRKKLDNLCLQANLSVDGECLGLLGPSGCGKSMTLKAIAGLVRPDEGRIWAGGRVLYDGARGIDLPPRKRRIGYLFQNYALFPHMTVEENIRTGLRSAPPEPDIFREKRRKSERSRLDELLSLFHLTGQAHSYPARLSGGQQQRTALARLLAAHPDVLLLDEPFSALDGHLKEELQIELRSLLHSLGKSVILVSHDRDEIYRLCSRTAVMWDGYMEEPRDTADLFYNPRTYTAARLTGCKNIARIGQIDGSRVYVPDWGVWLQTAGAGCGGTIPSYVGIRAHHILPVGDEGDDRQDAQVNCFFIRAERRVEDPFESTVLFSFAEGKKQTVWMKCEKNNSINETPRRVWIPPEHILLLEEGGADGDRG